MNKEQLQQKVANMEAELAEMKALLNKPEPTINYWQPKHGETYFYINKFGNVDFDTYSSLWPLGKVFKTEAEAQKYADYIKAEETLRRVIAEANQGWLPDWNNYDEDKYYIYFKTNEGKLYVNCRKDLKDRPNFLYIKNISDASHLIADYEQELITYLSY